MCSADQCNSNHSAYSANTGEMYAKMKGGYDSLRSANKVSYVKSTIGYGGI
ncbi:hypothetical protein J4476_04245 [Candidatus Woesearchaeota archaeon]|nr:MAG: hypothetical protein QT09_C0007G0076 [archaeon GW2011_AR18]MBS3161874.1 hypothetical protein [Candidatus Woesearchaeota archaeon]HIH25608.1 hypothetical protein [Nanoarchaeota archaeon]HLC86508.1 hypothetical protein [Candidatus Nanoarchaeia archaeon]